MRACGILMPVFSLPSEYGIGTLGKEAYHFVDFLKKAGQRYWQLLPLCPTNYGDSPYQSFSSAAGNPYFIDLETLEQEGLLAGEEYRTVDFGSDPTAVDYDKIIANRLPVLRRAYERFCAAPEPGFAAFCEREKGWLDDYALFRALKAARGGADWHDWELPLRRRDPGALAAAREELRHEVDFYRFIQYKFYQQWYRLKDYANQNGILMFGDMPIYVANDSADVWANPADFDLDEEGVPRVIAGCPPDPFAEDGQLWGMPVYDWEHMKHEPIPYRFWRERLGHAFRVFDLVRIDHFRGFESFYCVKYGMENAREGEWRQGPGMDLFRALRESFGDTLPIVAEDLGFLTPEVKQLLEDTGFPGMKVLQFAFDAREDSDYLPHHYTRNCVVYPGTHDNDTVIGWTRTAPPESVAFARRYMHVDDNEGFNWAMIRLAMQSVADTAIFTMADFMGLGSAARINTPATVGGNWKWRIAPGCINDWLAGIIRENVALYSRLPEQNPEE